MQHSIFDSTFAAIPRAAMYQGWTSGDPDVPPARLENWHPEDLAAYCGGEFTQERGTA